MALQGIARQTCRGKGGIKTVYIAPFSAVTTSAVTSGVADFAVGAGEFKEFKPRKEAGSSYVETEQVSVETAAFSFEKILTLLFTDYTVAKRNELAALAACETVAIIEFYSGAVVMAGHEDGMDTNGSESNSGANKNDGSRMSIVLRAMETVPTVFVDSADYANIVAGNAVV